MTRIIRMITPIKNLLKIGVIFFVIFIIKSELFQRSLWKE